MIVALKLPSGLMLGSLRLNGNHWPPGQQKPPHIIGGYGLTKDVPKQAWKDWLKRNPGSSLVANHIIHAADTEKEIKAWIALHLDVNSGMEAAFATAN